MTDVTETSARLLNKHPFFAVLWYQLLKVREDKSVRTAATDGRNVMINPDYYATLDIDEGMFVNAHEVGHVILDHMPRSRKYKDSGIGPDGKEWSHKKANYAMDYVVNIMLVDGGVGTMPQGALIDPKYRDWLWEDVYKDIPEPPSGGNGGGQGGGEPQPFDDHVEGEPCDSISEEELQTAIAAAQDAQKAMGEMPAGLQRIVDDILDPQVDWREHLIREVVASHGRDTYTWRRINRRRLQSSGLVYPGRTGYACGEIGVVIDTSASVSSKELSAFMGELYGVYEQATPTALHLFAVDAKVSDHTIAQDVSDLLTYQPKGGGGTNLECVYKYIQEQQIELETLIFLTDGGTPMTSNPTTADVIWVITTDMKAPYGATINMKL